MENQDNHPRMNRRRVKVATCSQEGLAIESPQEMAAHILAELESKIAPLRPDIVCLPEAFPGQWRDVHHEIAEAPKGPLSRPFADFAAKHAINLICPIFTKTQGEIRNSAVIFDRNGAIAGQYDKIHLPSGESSKGISPGPSEAPVFDLDFGRIGIQICWDMEFSYTWDQLEMKGAEIVFWPSAYAGGELFQAKARYHFPVVSSVWSEVAAICDLEGNILASTGKFSPTWAFGVINLEKAVVPTWPNYKHIDAIIAKYGDRVRIKTDHAALKTFIECVSDDLRIDDLLKEYDIPRMIDLRRGQLSGAPATAPSSCPLPPHG